VRFWRCLYRQLPYYYVYYTKKAELFVDRLEWKHLNNSGSDLWAYLDCTRYLPPQYYCTIRFAINIKGSSFGPISNPPIRYVRIGVEFFRRLLCLAEIYRRLLVYTLSPNGKKIAESKQCYEWRPRKSQPVCRLLVLRKLLQNPFTTFKNNPVDQAKKRTDHHVDGIRHITKPDSSAEEIFLSIVKFGRRSSEGGRPQATRKMKT